MYIVYKTMNDSAFTSPAVLLRDVDGMCCTQRDTVAWSLWLPGLGPVALAAG